MNNYRKIKLILMRSKLTSQQTEELLTLFATSENDELLPVVGIFEHDISWAERIYNNYSSKKEATKNFSQAKWQNIFKEEAEMIQAV